MKRNFIISTVLAVVSFGLLAAALVFEVLQDQTVCTFLGMGSSAAAFVSVIFGLNSWKES